jgi:predicted Holliday junction resolvase-like endonuclease
LARLDRKNLKVKQTKLNDDVALDIEDLIQNLKNPNLIASCPNCNEFFKLSEAVLFDGRKKTFPDMAEQRRQALIKEFEERTNLFLKKKLSAYEGAEKKAIEVGIGKIIERIVPAFKEFKMSLSDCRPLFEPIDLIVFNGATNTNVDSITFLEIKTGDSRLSHHQRIIKDAISSYKVDFKLI